MKTAAVGIVLLLATSAPALGAGDERALDEGTERGRRLRSLLADLKDPSARVRRGAVSSLSWLERETRNQVVPALAELLRDPDVEVREEVVSALWTFGGRHPGAIAALRLALKDGDPKVRSKAAYVLAWKNIDKKDNVALLLRALGDRDSADRRWAAWYLGRIEPDPLQVLPGLVSALRDQNAFVRQDSAKALGALGAGARSAAPALEALLDDKNESVRLTAALALWQTSGEKERTVSVLVKLLGYNAGKIESFDSLMDKALTTDETTFLRLAVTRSHTLLVREEAMRALGAMGPAAQAAVPALVPLALAGESRSSAARTLADLGSTAVPHLVRLLDARDPRIRGSAAEALGQFGPVARPAIPRLLDCLNDPDTTLRGTAAEALGRIALEPQRVVPALRAAVQTPGSGGDKAIEALGRFGPAAREAVPTLVEELREDRLHDRRGIVFALTHIGPEAREAVPALVDVLLAERGNLRSAAAETLGRIGPAAAPAVPALCEVLGASDTDAQRNAITALGEIGPAAAGSVARLIRALDFEPDSWIPGHAAAALGKIGPNGKEAIPALRSALRNPNRRVRVRAAWALWRIDGSKEPLLAALGDELEDVRRDAASYLGQLGPEAEPAVPGLIKALADEDEQVRDAAAEALGLIGVRAGAVPALKRALNDEQVRVRIQAAAALWKLEKAPEALTALAAVLTSTPPGDSFDHRSNAADALGRFGPEARAAGPALRECIARAPAYPRQKALEALQAIDPDGCTEVWRTLYDPPGNAPEGNGAPGGGEEPGPAEKPSRSRSLLLLGLGALVAGWLFVCVLLVRRGQRTRFPRQRGSSSRQRAGP
jgi:HEAT repeat protein